MMHTAYDSAHFFGGILLFLGSIGTAAYAVFVLIALALSAFRSLRALRTSFWLSGIISLPFLLASLIMLPYMAKILDNDSIQGLFLFVNATLLLFVWVGPTVQYRLARNT